MSKIHSPILHLVGRLWMWSFGWEVKAELPEAKKYVLVGGPHTSNWDFPFALALFYVLNLRLSWMGKSALFKPPFGFLMRAFGGVAIDRNSHHGIVEQMAEKFAQADELIIGIAAKGTRKKSPYWKSGFYWIAYEAQVPIVCCYLDYSRKSANIGLTLKPTGNVKADMDSIRAFYQGVLGKRPENNDWIRLKEEG